jgi:mannose-1-phosphate guanylyltransferase
MPIRQALVLAGGEGTRLRPLTTTIPKPVVPVANRPFLSYMVDWLASHGFDDVIVSCGFLADEVRAVLGDGDPGGTRIRYAEEPDPRGTAGAVKFAEDMLGERFVVLNGDILTDFDLSRLVDEHERAGARTTIALMRVEDPSAFGLVIVDDEGGVAEFREKPAPGEHIDEPLVNAGAYVIERDVLDRIAPDRAVSFEREVFPSLVGEGLFAREVQGHWLDIGTPERYLVATERLLAGTPSLVGEGAEVADGAQLQPFAVLGARCRVADGAVLERAVLLDNVAVGEGAVVRDSIVGPGATIGPHSKVEALTVVGERAEVPAHQSLAGARVH